MKGKHILCLLALTVFIALYLSACYNKLYAKLLYLYCLILVFIWVVCILIYLLNNFDKTVLNINTSFKSRPYFATIEIFKIVTTEKQFRTVFGICLHRGFLRKNLYVDLTTKGKYLKKSNKEFYLKCTSPDVKNCFKTYEKLLKKKVVR